MTEAEATPPIGPLNSVEKRIEEAKELATAVAISYIRGHKIKPVEAMKKLDFLVNDINQRREQIERQFGELMNSLNMLNAVSLMADSLAAGDKNGQ